MKLTNLTVLAAAGLGAVACSDASGPGAGAGVPTVSLSLGTRAAGAVSAAMGFFAGVAAPDTLLSNGDTLVIDQVEIVLREIELQRVNHDDCDSSAVDDDCEEFEAGPLLVDLPLGGGVETPITIAIDTGSYDEIEFEIHKLDDNNGEDQAFIAAHPDFVDVSIRVRGSFNGQPFVYETDLNVELEIELPRPLVIADSTTATNVTLLVNLDAWFRTPAGALVDPASGNKGGVNENLVKENIERSFEAFEDQDRDGDDRDESDD